MKADTLKKSILQWAIEGKLVPQLESEPEVEQVGEPLEDAPFVIPRQWKWIRLENLFLFIDYRGKTPIKSEYGVRLITASNIRKGYIDHKRVEYISLSEYENRQSRGISQKGDILFTTEAPLGNASLADIETYSTGQRVITLRSLNNLILHEFAVYEILSSYFQKTLKDNATGTTAQGIKAARLKKLWLPIPPLEEQHRIVAKLNELLPLVETYGKEQEALEKVEKEFPDKLRASLLQEAIQGKLVPQLESEPEVTQIGEAPEDVPFAIPEKWKWISASYVQTLVRGITFPASAKTKMQTHNSICCLTTGSVQEKYASKADVFVDQSFMKNTRQILQVGDVVISSANSKELVGKSILWEDDSGIQKTFGGFLTVARVKDSQTMIPEYLFLVYRYMFKTGYFANLSTQTTNIANLSNKLLDSLVFPIPPLEEQHRIAAKLNELLGAVVQLENTISAT